MRCRFFLAILLSACAGAQRPQPTTPRAQGPWVPEARARLGHVEDDALADIDAEVERLRAIAMFEIESEDPDHVGLDALIELHHFDLRRANEAGPDAVAAARHRIEGSEGVLVAALPVRGNRAFVDIVLLAPHLLRAHEREIIAALRTPSPLCAGARPSDIGLYFDALTLTLLCERDFAEAIAPLWTELSPELRLWLRARNVAPANDALTQAEANDLVAASFWGAQARLVTLMLAGELEPAQVLARSLAARDRANIPARLVVRAHEEIWARKLPREALRLLLFRPGPAELAHRFPDSVVAKLALLERLADAHLREDFERLRDALPDSALALVAPAMPSLEARVRGNSGAEEEAREVLRASESKTSRAYALARLPPADAEPREPAPQASDAERILALDPPIWALWWLDLPEVPRTVRARYVAGLGEGHVRDFAEWLAACFDDGKTRAECYRRRPVLRDHMEARALGAHVLESFTEARYWDAPKLFALFARFDGTAVSARPEYVYLRIDGLVRGGELEEARARLERDGRVLSRMQRLRLDTLLLDAENETEIGNASLDIDTLEVFIESMLTEGCPVPGAGNRDEGDAHGSLAARIDRTLDVPTATVARLEPLLALYSGPSRATLAAYLAIAAIHEEDRAAFDRALAAGSFAGNTRLARLLMRFAANAFPTAPRVAASDFSIDWFMRYRGRAPRSAAPGADHGPEGAEVPEADDEALPPSLDAAYERFVNADDDDAARTFLSMRTDDANARRVQCDVAMEVLERAGLLASGFGVPRSRDDEALITRTRHACEGVPLGPRARDRYASIRASTLGGPSGTSIGTLDGSRLLQPDWRDDSLALAALIESPPNYVLARLVGVNEVLSLAVEGRAADARRAAQRDEREARHLAWLMEDLAARRLDEHGARALLWLGRPRHPYDDGVSPELGALLAAYPRSKSVAWVVASTSSRPMNASERLLTEQANVLFAAAGDEVEILLALEHAFVHAGRRSLATRALTRARAIDPRATPLADDEAGHCSGGAPPH